ncbi:uncharacterized protein [Watersipora subatra]|uniref:uncharacterized protein n=1 Tax=Watersipora subatra TaxID=2589382 RepID=UPI00355C6156
MVSHGFRYRVNKVRETSNVQLFPGWSSFQPSLLYDGFDTSTMFSFTSAGYTEIKIELPGNYTHYVTKVAALFRWNVQTQPIGEASQSSTDGQHTASNAFDGTFGENSLYASTESTLNPKWWMLKVYEVHPVFFMTVVNVYSQQNANDDNLVLLTTASLEASTPEPGANYWITRTLTISGSRASFGSRIPVRMLALYTNSSGKLIVEEVVLSGGWPIRDGIPSMSASLEGHGASLAWNGLNSDFAQTVGDVKWWKVDLLAMYNVIVIQLFNRKGVREALSMISTLVSTKVAPEDPSPKSDDWKTCFYRHPKYGPVAWISLQPEVMAIQVAIHGKSAYNLSLDEVNIYGYLATGMLSFLSTSLPASEIEWNQPATTPTWQYMLRATKQYETYQVVLVEPARPVKCLAIVHEGELSRMALKELIVVSFKGMRIVQRQAAVATSTHCS